MFYQVSSLILVGWLASSYAIEEAVNSPSTTPKVLKILERAAARNNLNEDEIAPLIEAENLRSVREESRFLQGFLWLTEYTELNCPENSFDSRDVFRLNVCANNLDQSSTRARGWITARGNLGLTVDMWSGPDCTGSYSKRDLYLPNNVCTGAFRAKVDNTFGTVPQNTLTTIEHIDQKTCVNSNDPTKVAAHATVERFNTCLTADDDADDESDWMITACSNKGGVTVQRFSTTDGSCGTPTEQYMYNPANECLWYDAERDENQGWTNYRCN